MLQREVADRLTAAPGTKEYGVLTILIGQSADSRQAAAGAAARRLSAGAKSPFGGRAPRVSRAGTGGQEPRALRAGWFRRSSRGAGRRSPTRSKPFLPARRCPRRALKAADLDGRRRPETLSIPELVRLADAFAASARPSGLRRVTPIRSVRFRSAQLADKGRGTDGGKRQTGATASHPQPVELCYSFALSRTYDADYPAFHFRLAQQPDRAAWRLPSSKRFCLELTWRRFALP